MRLWPEQRRICTYRNDPSATGWAFTDIPVIEKPDDCRGIQILQPGQILFTAKEITAQSDLTILITRRQKTIVTDPDEPFGRDMHQETTNEFFSGDSDFFPLSLVFVIFCSIGNSAVRHAFNTVVADRDPMGILSKILDNGLRAIERFLAVRDPLFFITGVQQFLERIVVFEALRAAVEFKLSVFPKMLQLRKILAAEKTWNDPDGKEEIFSVVFPMVIGIKTTSKDNGVDAM